MNKLLKSKVAIRRQVVPHRPRIGVFKRSALIRRKAISIPQHRSHSQSSDAFFLDIQKNVKAVGLEPSQFAANLEPLN